MDWLSNTLKSGKKTSGKVEEKNTSSSNSNTSSTENSDSIWWLEVVDEPDDEFLKKFDTFTLEKWDHRTHLRIAWVLLTRHGRRQGMKKIFDGIKKYIELSGKTRNTFHETMTYFWV